LKFFQDKKGLATTYAGFFWFFLFFSVPIGGIYYTLSDGDTFPKLSQIVSKKAITDIDAAANQFTIAFFFILFMCLLTGFMYALTAKSRELAFRFFSITFGVYTVIAFGYKVIITSAMNAAIANLEDGPLKVAAPAVAKSFENNFLLFGLAGAILSTLALLIGLLGKGQKES
jgi:flagellar biosynthesis protein FlhB